MNDDKATPMADAIDLEELARAYVEKIEHDLAAYGHKAGDPIPDEVLDMADDGMWARFEREYPMNGRSPGDVMKEAKFTFEEMKRRAREIIARRANQERAN